MFRSLHMKLMLILLLLITSLMTVVGAFLTTSVSKFYIDTFYQQMNDVFGADNSSVVSDLRNAAEEDNAVERISDILSTNAGNLGIDYNTRNYFVLDGQTGTFLSGSAGASELPREQTANLLTARNAVALQDDTMVGDKSDITADYMDAAIPIFNGDNAYIIYILDNKETVSGLNAQLVMIILQALVIGLLISVLLSFLLSKAMVDPIERLTAGAEKVASGDFDSELPVESTDEIGILTGTFNEMAGVLQSTLEAMENERNKLDTLFLHMTDGVVAFDHDGHLIHCNPAAKSMLHRSVDENCTYDDLFGDLYPFSQMLALQRPNYAEAEKLVDERTLELYLAPFSDQASGGVLIVLHDVTEQHRNEERRKEFVANVSHELKTPIALIQGYAEGLCDGMCEDEESRSYYCEVIMDEANKMNKMVRQLLTLTALEFGNDTPSIAAFDVTELVHDLINSSGILIQQNAAKVSVDMPETLVVMGDEFKIEEVVTNYLTNAMNHLGGDHNIHIWSETLDGVAKIHVYNNGTPIPEEDLPNLWTKFYKVDKARTRAYGGSGIGLSIVKAIMEAHHQQYGVANHEDGVEFWFTLALAPEKPEEEE